MAPSKPKPAVLRPSRRQNAFKALKSPFKPAAPLTKRHRAHPSPPKPNPKPQKSAKMQKRIQVLISPPRKRVQQSKNARDHPLSLAFSEATTTYRTSVHHTTTTALSTAHAVLTTRLSALRAAETASLQKLDAAPATSATRIPLARERLEVSQMKDGVRSKTVVGLGDAMGAFGESVRAEERRVGELWRLWGVVQGEIGALGGRVLGAGTGGNAAGNGEGTASGGEGYARGGEGYAREVAALEKELERRVEKVVEEVGVQGETMVEQFESDQTAFEARMRQQRQMFAIMMQNQEF